FEFHSRMKSGEIRIGLSSAEVMSIAGEPCRIIVITDITERKRAEEALRQSEEKLRLMFQAVSEGIAIIDLQGVIIDCNERAVSLYGVSSKEEILGKNCFNFIDEREREKAAADIQKLIAGEAPRSIEFNITKADGSRYDTEATTSLIKDASGNPTGIIAIIRDITERKRAEEGLRESEEKYRTLFESAAQGILIADTETKKFKDANPAVCTMLGYSQEELVKMDVGDIHPKTSLELVLADFTAQARGEKILSTLPCLKKDGTIIYADIKAAKAIIDGRECNVGFFTDITVRKQAEEELKQALSNMEQSNLRLAATNKELETFSYSVSHDLRSPLRSIDGFSQALLEDYANKLDATAQDYLKRLRNASQKMGELIDGMLRLSRLSRSELHLERIDLGALAIEIATRLRESQPERQVEFVIGGDLTANGDPQLLHTLLENLLGNAWKFTGKVPRAIIEFDAIQSNGQKTFFVKDNGAGFDMTYADKLFGVFQRLHDATEFPGTGIGLATVRRIVNRHGGTVRAEGEVGKGATFYFTLG
ncbi:MAG: PAS domain S-box protein, partial [Dehalococcoidales bacterium]